MKKSIIFVLSLLFILPSLRAENIGVPSECEDVMLQAFYWDSYTLTKYGRTQWTDLMKDTAAINANFDLVWFPPSASSTGGVGYYHACLSNQDSNWGTRLQLTSLITALHNGGTKVIGDIVINHRGNKSSWCDFYKDDFTFTYGSFQLTEEHICSNDECFTTSGSTCYNSDTHGAADTGTNDAGCRDLDHSSEYVQKWAKAYLKWMMGKMKYDGFRYDMTRGYHGRYLSMYNEATNPYISVSEFWESIGNQKSHLLATNYNTMIFDFQQKYELGKAIGNNYSLLKKNSNTFRGQGLEKYAVTFIDNHDTFERSDNQSDEFGGYNADLSTSAVRSKILQANAYILMMPGIPCVFWPHWKRYTEEINELIAVRKLAGIHSESAVTDESSALMAYSGTIQGHRGKVVLRLGTNRDQTTPTGFHKVVDGTTYTVFLEDGTGIEEIRTQPANNEKFIKDGKLYIRHGNKTYDAIGNVVE